MPVYCSDTNPPPKDEEPRKPLPEPSPPTWKRPEAPPQGQGDGKLPEPAPAGRYALPGFSPKELWTNWE